MIKPNDTLALAGKFAIVLQWRGLPYGEATFEKVEDIEKAGGAQDIKELHVRAAASPLGLCVPGVVLLLLKSPVLALLIHR